MSSLNINNEYGSLTKVILGVANSFGGTPQIEECYDPKSREHVQNGTFLHKMVNIFMDYILFFFTFLSFAMGI